MRFFREGDDTANCGHGAYARHSRLHDDDAGKGLKRVTFLTWVPGIYSISGASSLQFLCCCTFWAVCLLHSISYLFGQTEPFRQNIVLRKYGGGHWNFTTYTPCSLFFYVFSPAPGYVFLLVYIPDRIFKSTSKAFVLAAQVFWGKNQLASIPFIFTSK